MKTPATILGTGWVTALGAGATVYDRLRRGEIGHREPVQEGFQHDFWKFSPEPELYLEARKLPRLRRSSRISHMAVTAALAAMQMAQVDPHAGLALVLAVSSGGVLYTRRFFQTIAENDASHASPLLFPETVYNAPASHIAAALGIDGPAYTVTGDTAIGFSALALGETLLASGEAGQVLVVGAEECDPLLCEAYRTWGLVRTGESWPADGRGSLLGEGAAAVLLGEGGSVQLEARHQASPRRLAASHLQISGANNTRIDREEKKFELEVGMIWRPKWQWGETLGAAALMQTVAAAEAIKQQAANSATATAVGWNQECGWARLESSRP